MASNQDQTDYAIRNETTNHLNNNSNSNNVIKRSVNAGNNEAALNESVPDVENKSSKQPKSKNSNFAIVSQTNWGIILFNY